METEDYSKTKSKQDQDEIDLSKLFVYIGKKIEQAFKGLARLFFLFLDTIFSNLKYIITLILVGAILGIAYFFLVKPFYESRMTLGSNYYKGQLIGNSIENLNLLCKENNYNSLGKLLKIPAAKAKSLKSIQIEPVIAPSTQLLIDLYKETEGSTRRLDSLILSTEDTTFQIKVQVYDTTALSGLDTSLVNYILKNKFVKKRIEIQRENLKIRKAKLIKESLSLDTLKRNIALSYRNKSGRTGTNNVILDDKGTNPIDIYREDMNLFEQQLKIDRLLYINSEIEIIDPFIAYGEPKSGTLLTNTTKGLFVGFILAFIFVIYKVIKVGIYKLKSILEREDNE